MSTNQTHIRYKLVGVRLTKLNTCGVVVDDGCSSFTDKCIVTVEESPEYKDREEFFFENGDGDFCATATVGPKLKWLNLTLTFHDVNPGILPFVTGDTVLLNDAASAQQIGYGRDYGAVNLSNFALEGWTRIAATCDDPDGCPEDGNPFFGYTLYPWVKEGTIGDVTYGNDAIDLVINAIAVRNSGWGTGPYNVVKSAAAATLGVPMPLLVATPSTRFSTQLLTQLPPPFFQCDCTDLTQALTFADTGVLMGTVTFPTRGGTPILPGYVTWGDASAPQLVTSGTTVTHTYAAPASYAPTYKPSGESGITYVAASTPIA